MLFSVLSAFRFHLLVSLLSSKEYVCGATAIQIFLVNEFWVSFFMISDVTPPRIDNLKKEPSETPEGGATNSVEVCQGKINEQSQAAMLSNGENKELLRSCGWNGNNEVLQTEEIDMNQVPQLSPESPPSFGDVKDMDGNRSAPGSICGVSARLLLHLRI